MESWHTSFPAGSGHSPSEQVKRHSTIISENFSWLGSHLPWNAHGQSTNFNYCYCRKFITEERDLFAVPHFSIVGKTTQNLHICHSQVMNILHFHKCMGSPPLLLGNCPSLDHNIPGDQLILQVRVPFTKEAFFLPDACILDSPRWCLGNHHSRQDLDIHYLSKCIDNLPSCQKNLHG